MADNYEIVYSPSIKATNENKEIQDSVADHDRDQANNPLYKVIIPQYMYKPAWGFPRYQPLQLLRQLGRNVYASSAFKAVKDIVIDTPWRIVKKEGVAAMRSLLETFTKSLIVFILYF